jgi:uncharacterized protein YggE
MTLPLVLALAAGLALAPAAFATRADLLQPDRPPLDDRADRPGPPRVTPRLNTTGYAEVRREPDQAEVSLGVAATGKTSAEAISAVNASMAKVVAAVKALGQPGLSVQTQTINLTPQYRIERDHQQTQPPEIIGHTAQTTVRFITAGVAGVGPVIDTGLKAGANQLYGISFSLKDDAEARAAALRLAAQDAKAKADVLAGALGVSLGPVLEANTDGANLRPFMQRGVEHYAMAAKADFTPTSVEAGQVVVSATVSVSYLIQPQQPRTP